MRDISVVRAICLDRLCGGCQRDRINFVIHAGRRRCGKVRRERVCGAGQAAGDHLHIKNRSHGKVGCSNTGPGHTRGKRAKSGNCAKVGSRGIQLLSFLLYVFDW